MKNATTTLKITVSEKVEHATLVWFDRSIYQRLLVPIGNIPPVEFENLYYEQMEGEAQMA